MPDSLNEDVPILLEKEGREIKLSLTEESLTYSQDETVLDADNIDLTFSKSYNSRSNEKGAFGFGWTHGFDLQLLNVYNEDDKDFSNLVFRDATGSIYRFIKGENGEYVSSEGEYITLKAEEKTIVPEIKGSKQTVTSSYSMHTSDNIDYFFNSGGQLVFVSEPNGSFVTFEYDKNIGLLEKVTTNKGSEISLKYNSDDPLEDMLLVTEAVMPDSSKRIYEYGQKDDSYSLLEKVREKASNGEELTYEYKYTNGEKPDIETIKDAGGESYKIKYDEEGRVSSAEYPNGEGYDFEYSRSGSNSKTKVSTFTGRGFLSSGEVISKEEAYRTEMLNCLTDKLAKYWIEALDNVEDKQTLIQQSVVELKLPKKIQV